MATPLLQHARQRKMIYFGAIVVLFTLSLIHREFFIKPQATRLQLRETVRGEVELTSSAVRLMLTGSRGLAVTILWYNACEMQKRNEWNELELIVKSITKLQPYFITPWLYQSWNISFNVAVECDRPRDKYYYVSRGLELLAEGERRNSGTADRGAASDPDRIVIPGNPELRHFMGFIYQLKIGNSDEQKTMRSLLELSCIDPVERNPARFLGEKGEVNLEELAKFSSKYPRLVRRLNEQLEYDNPQRIVQFLQDHQNIPNRFKPIEKSGQATAKGSDLKDPLKQFPILPPPEGRGPNTEARVLTASESVDVFLICRTWFEFAQKPLPPAEESPGPVPADYDKLKHRVPKGMVIQLFRQYPARAQIYIAEALESEGFFDSDGFDMSGFYKKWLNREVNKADYTFGTETMYHSRLAWGRGHEMYKDFGIKNGLYLSPAEFKKLTVLAEEIRKQENLKPGPLPEFKPEWREGTLRKSLDAHLKLYFSEYYRTLSNFDAYLYQSEGEADPVTVTMRKKLFFADRSRRRGAEIDVALDLYHEAFALYLHTCLKYPRFAQVPSMQEDFYEAYQRSLGLTHVLNPDKFRDPAVLAAKIAYWPAPAWQEAIIQAMIVCEKQTDQQEMTKVFPMRRRFGALDLIQYYDGHGAKERKEIFYAASQVGQTLGLSKLPFANVFPGHENYMLTRVRPMLEEREPIPENWVPLISPGTRSTTRGRLGLDR